MKMIGVSRNHHEIRSLAGPARSRRLIGSNPAANTLLLAVALAGCPPRPSVPPPPPPRPALALERWVDASAAEGGDGTEARPFKALGLALERPGTSVHVRTGLYRGPFALPRGSAIDGPGSAVLFVEGGEGTVVSAGDGDVSGVSLQGGAVGLAVAGHVRADGVHCSGQRRAAVEVRGGELELARADVQATQSEVLGVSVKGGRAAISETAFSGPFRRAVQVEGAAVTVERSRFTEAVTAVQLLNARGVLKAVWAKGGRGAAVFAGQGAELEVDGLEVEGHEYALLSREARVSARGVTSRGAEQAGIGLVRSRSVLEDVTVTGSGPSGAVEVVGGEVTLRRFHIERAASYGVHARSAKVAIADGEIAGVEGDEGGSLGDGLHLREAKGAVERVSVRGAAGSGLLIAEGSDVRGTDLVLERCRWGGVVVETLSTFTGRTITARDCGGAALVIPTEAAADVSGLTSERNQEGAVFADCHENARATLRAVTDDAPGARPPCVVQAPAGDQ